MLLIAFFITTTQWGCQKDARVAPSGGTPNSISEKEGLPGSDLFIATTWMEI